MMEKITKETMEQYEKIRQSGACNMLDYYCVQGIASKMEMYSLASLSREDYGELLMNFGTLMKEHNIKQ